MALALFLSQAVAAGEMRQDHALCLMGDLERHAAHDARGDDPVSMLADSMCLGFCPCCRWLICPCAVWKAVKAYLAERRQMQNEPPQEQDGGQCPGCSPQPAPAAVREPEESWPSCMSRVCLQPAINERLAA